jgi:hypothetical protein
MDTYEFYVGKRKIGGVEVIVVCDVYGCIHNSFQEDGSYDGSCTLDEVEINKYYTDFPYGDVMAVCCKYSVK